MSILQALLLGVVQGLTEFLPVSSSAHLVLVPWLLGWELPDEIVFAFDVLVQLGTLLAVFAYFWKDLVGIVRGVLVGLAQRRPVGTPEARLGWLVALATLPAVVGVIFKDEFEAMFSSPVATAVQLLFTAALLVAGERLARGDRPLDQLNWLDALVMGAMQALAIVPGISRSGATLAGGRARGLSRSAAARFSFLMSVPVMLGAGLIALFDLLALPNVAAYLAPIVAGFLAAAVVGYLAIRWFLGYLARRSLYPFAIYCVVASLFCLFIAALR
jgi:undecaprenyl-diphosphatase